MTDPKPRRAARTAARRTALALVAIALAVGGCGGDDDGRPAATSTTVAPSSTSATTTTTDATTTTTATPPTTTGEPCPEPTPPAAREDVVEVAADVDGDDRPDLVRSYRDAAWSIEVELARGGGARVELQVSPGAGVRVLGGADVDGDGAAEIWARTGSGASTTIVGLVRLVGCSMHQVVFGPGEPVELPVGGSVGSAAGVVCEATAGGADLVASTALHRDTGTYDVTSTAYALEGITLARVGEPTTTTVGADDPAFARATTLTCGDLAL